MGTLRSDMLRLFEHLEFDSVTIAPYMGKDSVEPFLEYKGKYAILLILTSNEGASDFQLLNAEENPYMSG